MEDTIYFVIESWIWYAVGIFIIILRLCGEIRRHGVQGLKTDDYVMIVSTLFYTLFTVMSNYTAKAFSAGESSVAGLNELALEDESSYADGSKYILVAEQGMINTLYLLKICMLLLYYRLMPDGRFKVVLQAAGAYVSLCWIGTQLGFFLLTCQPFSGNWATPPPDIQCVSWSHYSITQGIFNISSDCVILTFPFPLFLRTHYPIKQKIYLYCVFSMGIFVLVCAILNKIHTNEDGWIYWNIREAGQAVIVSNIPMLVSFFRSLFFKDKSNLSTGSGRKSIVDVPHC